MKVLLAPQELKSSLTATQAVRALTEGLRRVRPAWKIEALPLADGGPGTLDLVSGRIPEAMVCRATVEDPLGRPVDARWLRLEGDTALVEMAEAAGLWRLGTQRRPLDSDTTGVGQLIAAARSAGCTRIIVGAGGSATSDGGAGAVTSLGGRFLDAEGRPLEPRPTALVRAARVERPAANWGTLEVWTDVRNPLADAATVYAPQKGATPEDVTLIVRAHRALASLAPEALSQVPGSGAAGGLAFGLLAFVGARLAPGFESLSQLLKLEALVASVDLVVTAEGRLDAQSTFEKGPWALADVARRSGVPCVAFVGSNELPEAVWKERFQAVIELGPRAHAAPAARLAQAIANALVEGRLGVR